MDTLLELAQTSSPPLIRYFDLLPTELLQHIIAHLLPFELKVASYHRQRKMVPSLSLVSKRFYQILRPALAAALWLGGGQNLNRRSDKNQLWNHCWWLRVSIAKMNSEMKTDLEQIVKFATRLDDVACSGPTPAVTLLLATNITKLHLYGVRDPSHFVLASSTLEQLSLSDFDLCPQEDPIRNLPSLRHLGYSLERPNKAFTNFLASLAPQLTSLFAPLVESAQIRMLYQRYDTITVLHSSEVSAATGNDLLSSSMVGVKHLRLLSQSDFGEDGHPYNLLDSWDIAEWVEQFSSGTNSSLESLYLDSHLSSSNRRLNSMVRTDVVALETTCRQRKIKIISENSVANHPLDSLISQEFLRRVEKDKRSEEVRRA